MAATDPRRRRLLRALGAATAVAALPCPSQPRMNGRLRLFLCGDVMLGRGVDQILAHPGDATLHEGYLRSALDYVHLAERTNGPIARAVDPAYVWGDALVELDRHRPDLRIVNLETAVTARGEALPKGINYRMNPRNIDVLRAAAIDCCSLANNHVLDWGPVGLTDTLSTLSASGIASAGAGTNAASAWQPANLNAGDSRVQVYACADSSSGVPDDWAADTDHAGVALLPDLSVDSARRLAANILPRRQAGDRVVVSLHWGDNWGFGIPPSQRAFARTLIDAQAADVIHGHSAHHVKGVEIYRNRPILYGCGDFLNDYEGIPGHEHYRGDLGLMYFVTLAPDGSLSTLDLVPTRLRRMRVERAGGADRQWLSDTLHREYAALGTSIRDKADGGFTVAAE